MVKNKKDLTPKKLQRPNTGKTVSKGNTANIRVVVRVRPPNAREQDTQRIVINVLDENSLIFDPEQQDTPFFYHGVIQKRRDLLKKQHKNLQFNFDRVFAMDCSNQEVFNHSTSDLIKKLMEGCNCSVFVYGATGAGKTYTMLGKNDQPGITFLTMQELFKQKEALSVDRSFELFITYLEVYNENVLDLLNPNGSALQLRDDAQFSVRVAGLTHKKIQNPDELFSLLEQGNRNRTQHPTDANAESSRSHAVFQVYVQMNIKSTGQKMIAKLSMIDLAGSERAAATGCRGMRFTEGGNINRSLLSLGNCINALADGLRHVPYRDSKLTRILKDSLGENCHTVMIANVSPSVLNYEDTYNTLKYANRAKKIKVNVKKNLINCDKTAAQYAKIIEELNAEIMRLKEENLQLLEYKNTHGKIESKDSLLTEKVSSEIVPYINPVNNDLEKTLKNLFECYARCEQRRNVLTQKKLLLEKRINFKDEANSRLSNVVSSNIEKENGRKRLLQTMDRLKKQGLPCEKEALELETKMIDLKAQINELVADNPQLMAIYEVEQAKLDVLIEQLKNALNESLKTIDSRELNIRGELMEEMGNLLQQWYYLLKNQNMMTDSWSHSYKNLTSRLLGYCSVSFDDGDSGLSASSSSTSTSDTQESRPPKRKLISSETNTTFSSSQDKSLSESKLIKDSLPMPAKRVAKGIRTSPRIFMQKENQKVFRKPVGTMGTASRFPKSGGSTVRRFGLPVNRT